MANPDLLEVGIRGNSSIDQPTNAVGGSPEGVSKIRSRLLREMRAGEWSFGDMQAALLGLTRMGSDPWEWDFPPSQTAAEVLTKMLCQRDPVV